MATATQPLSLEEFRSRYRQQKPYFEYWAFWDAMILASAEQSGAEQLLTEDLNAGEKIAGIEIVNPFSGA